MADKKVTITSKEAREFAIQNRRIKKLQLRLSVAKRAGTALRSIVASAHLEDPYLSIAEDMKSLLIPPPYSPAYLYRLYEESRILPRCISAMVANIPGFGYEVVWRGAGEAPSQEEREKDPGWNTINDFILKANNEHSLYTLRTLLRLDYEITGNWYLEVIRYGGRKQEIALLYRAKPIYMRLGTAGPPVDVTYKLKRGGKMKSTTITRTFRRYAFIHPANLKKIKWFKELGDPRKMDCDTGKYEEQLSQGETILPEKLATEILHYKEEGGSMYGVPRWIGNILGVIGVKQADYVNYDLFENQGIPPFLILVSGGVLTGDSIDEVEALMRKAKGVESFNKVAILEAEDISGDIEESTRVKIEIKTLTEYRKEDAMFLKYTDSNARSVRQAFRLPPLYTGEAEEYTFATAKASRVLGEEQVFKPERKLEDEVFNNRIFVDIPDWDIATRGPEGIRSDEIATMFNNLAKAGVFTINQAIVQANKMFDLQIKTYPDADKWANYPLILINALSRLGALILPKGLQDPKFQPKVADKPKPQTQPRLGDSEKSALENIFDSETVEAIEKFVELLPQIEELLQQVDADV